MRGMTQERLGEAVGMAHASIQRIESGKQALTENTVTKLSAALQVHPGELFEPLPVTGIEDKNEKLAAEMARRLSKDDRDRWFTIAAALAKERLKVGA